MTQIERQIRTVQRRLWLNGWLHRASWCLALTSCCFACVVLLTRLYGVHGGVLLFWSAVGLGGMAILAAVIWTQVTRIGPSAAAAKLDEAAGLRERISSGRHCLDADDPFARAVVADAERISSSISVRSHIRLTIPRPLPFTAGSILLVAAMFLVPPGLLKGTEAVVADQQREELQTTKVAVKRQFDVLRDIVEATPTLEELKTELKLIDPKAGGKLRTASDVRHEASKKIDNLSDLVKLKRARNEYAATKEMRKMLRGLKPPQGADTPTRKLVKALSEGDFKTAREAIQALKEQLATLQSPKDREMAKKVSRQLDDLARQLDRLAVDRKLVEKLRKLGIDPKDAERLLARLSKKDLDQLKKMLEKKGLSAEQIEKIAKQLQRRQGAGNMAKRLAGAMKNASQAAAAGQMGDSVGALSLAAEQLSELEQLEQEMAQLESVASALADAQANLDQPCPT